MTDKWKLFLRTLENKKIYIYKQIKTSRWGKKFRMFRIFFVSMCSLMCDKLKANAKLCYTCNEKKINK